MDFQEKHLYLYIRLSRDSFLEVVVLSEQTTYDDISCMLMMS